MHPTISNAVDTQHSAFFRQDKHVLASAIAAGLPPPEGTMWHGRALGLVHAITPVLCYLRDNGHLRLDSATFIQSLNFDSIETLVSRHSFVFDGQEHELWPDMVHGVKREFEKAVHRIDDPVFDATLAVLKAYLQNLPGYSEQAAVQSAKTVELHGYVQMQLAHSVRTLPQ